MKQEETYNNLGKSIHVFNEVETFLNLIIVHHIEPKDKSFFLDYILNPSVVNFGAKIKILINLNIFTSSQIKKIRDYSTNRNVFAHSNRTHYTTAEKVENDRKILINIHSVIYKTNSEGKISKINYFDFIKKHLELQNQIIDIISEYIIENNIDTKYKAIENLRLLKN